MPEPLWLIRREGSKLVGPVTTELVVRGLMAGRIPHDCMVQKKGETSWARILDVDVFHDAMQATTVMPVARVSAAEAATTMMERPPDMDEDSGPQIPDESLEALGRAWHAPEWMVFFPGEKDMRGPFTLSEVKKRVEDKHLDGVQVCRMRTFDWMTADEAFEAAGEPPLLVPSSAKIKLVDSAPPPRPATSSDDPNRPIDWKAPLYRVMHAGELQGPTSLEQIQRALHERRLKPDDEISLVDGPAWLPLGPFMKDARKRKMQDKTVIVARKLGSDPLATPMPGIALPPRKWATYVVLAAIVAAFLAAFLFKALR